MDLECIILSEVNTIPERNKLYVLSYMRNLANNIHIHVKMYMWVQYSMRTKMAKYKGLRKD